MSSIILKYLSFTYSPAVLYDGKIILKKGENLHLKYRTWIIPGKTSVDALQEKIQ